jgi:hypothetical protein
VEITIFEDYAFGQHNTVSVTIPEEYVMIGGGAQVDFRGGPGAFLTGSWPTDDRNFRTWNAESKDHVVADVHFLYADAIGMRLIDDNGNYVPPVEIKKHMLIRNAISDTGPSVTAGGMSGVYYLMLSGGARVINPFNIGKLLTESDHAPYNAGWLATAKSCKVASSNAVMAYAIYIDYNDIAGFGILTGDSRWYKVKTEENNTGNIYANPVNGYVISGVGASITHYKESANRFLYAISPLHLDGTYGCYAADKDHVISNGMETLTICVKGIKKDIW